MIARRRSPIWILSVILPVMLSVAVRPAHPTAPAPQRYVIVPAGSQVIYRVAETFINEGNRLNVAVGVTNAVRGEIMIHRDDPRQSRIGVITVDISRFQSDSSRRDNAIRGRWLESSRFPTAEFTPTAIEGLPAAYEDGKELRLEVTGRLKIRDVTRPTTFLTVLTLSGTTLTGLATTKVLMTDFGFQPPSILGILRAENEVNVEFRFTARPP
jgi:polyisoprenoid-binding protein YceI